MKDCTVVYKCFIVLGIVLSFIEDYINAFLLNNEMMWVCMNEESN
jgi:hypothetical protein